MLIDTINKTISEGGKVLIPMPVAGLAQEMLLTIDMYMKVGKILSTRVMVEKSILEATSIYEAYPEYLSREIRQSISQNIQSPFRSEQITEVESATLDEKPAIILAPSSMLIGGPSVNYLKQISDDSRSSLVLTSYQAQGSPGRSILEGNRQISICDQNISIGCQVQIIDGFNDHSDYNQIMAYIGRLRPKIRRVLVNHGERSKVQNLASSINRVFKVQTQHPLLQEAIKIL
jgi:predicted metal-dependent RNase